MRKTPSILESEVVLKKEQGFFEDKPKLIHIV